MKSSVKMWVGGLGLLTIVLLCFILPRALHLDAQGVYLDQRLISPSFTHLMGTDFLGRDQFARVLMGGATTLSLAFTALVISGGMGTILGVLSGYCGGIVDAVIGWIMDTLLAFPNMILALGIAGMLGPSLRNILISVIVVNWVAYAKLTRSITQSLKHKSFIQIARMNGASHFQILQKHVFGQLFPYLSVLMSMDMGVMILRIAGLSFLGLGATAVQAEWGMMVQEARKYMSVAPWLLIFPSAAIMLTVIFANLLGEGLRAWNHPKRGYDGSHN